MQTWAREQERAGRRVAFVPTMGYLHEGHLSLVREARRRGDLTVVSIFVNPTQFGPNEDFSRYPRDFERDRHLCEAEGVDVIFAPSAEAMYPPGSCTRVFVEGMQDRLCGRSRPGHFMGVCTVVLKLFEIVRPAVAVFGWKDAQQFLILRRMVQDLNLPVEMIGVETVREPDGLACSSRNVYLSPEERRGATILFRSLQQARAMIEDEHRTDAASIRKEMTALITQTPGARLDYVEIVSMDTLEPLEQVRTGGTLIALAVYFGRTRLIDNIRV
ncbi:MAG: pantoate--beta-alanine ligase [Candidatus Sumerlaeia bacterium]